MQAIIDTFYDRGAAQGEAMARSLLASERGPEALASYIRDQNDATFDRQAPLRIAIRVVAQMARGGAEIDDVTQAYIDAGWAMPSEADIRASGKRPIPAADWDHVMDGVAPQSLIREALAQDPEARDIALAAWTTLAAPYAERQGWREALAHAALSDARED